MKNRYFVKLVSYILVLCLMLTDVSVFAAEYTAEEKVEEQESAEKFSETQKPEGIPVEEEPEEDITEERINKLGVKFESFDHSDESFFESFTQHFCEVYESDNPRQIIYFCDFYESYFKNQKDFLVFMIFPLYK